MKFALVLLSLPFAVFAEPDSKQEAKAPPTPLDATLTDPAFFTKPLAEVYQTYHKQATPEVKERQEKHRAKMLEKGAEVRAPVGSGQSGRLGQPGRAFHDPALIRPEVPDPVGTWNLNRGPFAHSFRAPKPCQRSISARTVAR
jgi:hypothetical protein